MKYRRFGRVEWQVSEIGYGMWGMGSWSGSDDEESLLSLQRSVELGCNFFDTAWVYGRGRSEKLLGQVLRANPGVHVIQPRKSHPRISNGPAKGISPWMTAIHPIISRGTSTAV
jgi:aryl-alcohol dehydrogenase-like predicted oxidoreductase